MPSHWRLQPDFHSKVISMRTSQLRRGLGVLAVGAALVAGAARHAAGNGGGSEDRGRGGCHVDRPALLQSLSQQQRRRAHLRQARADGPGLEDDPGPRDVVEDDRRHDVGIQATQRRQVPRRIRTDRRGRRVLDRPCAAGAEQPRPLHRLHQGDRIEADRRPVHAAPQVCGAVSAGAQRPVDHLHRVQEGSGQRHDGRLQQRQGDDRQRPFQVRPLRERRPGGTGAQ